MEFCSPFDAALAESGPAGVFLRDPEGAWRFDPSWTRDAWGRAPGPHVSGWAWLLLRDHASGFVVLALVTSPTLIEAHPRLDVRRVESVDAGLEALAAMGTVPVVRAAW